MLKLRFSKPSFRKYMDGEICVCSYKCEILDTNTKEVLDSFKVSGTAKLADGDIMSDLGAKLADSRAKLAAYKKAANIISDEDYEGFAEMIEAVCNLLDFSDFMHYMKKKEIEHIKYLRREG